MNHLSHLLLPEAVFNLDGDLGPLLLLSQGLFVESRILEKSKKQKRWCMYVRV